MRVTSPALINIQAVSPELITASSIIFTALFSQGEFSTLRAFD